MSPVRSKRFGDIRAIRSKMGLGQRATLEVTATGAQIENFVDLIEFFYETHARIAYDGETVTLVFQCAPQRSRAAARFAARFCDMELHRCRIWF